ncbi:hypothetical protein [Desulfothermus sp.]
MLKLKVKPKGEKIIIYLPEELVDQELEVIVSPVKKKKNQIERIRNILKNRSENIFHSIDNPITWQRSLREEWEK